MYFQLFSCANSLPYVWNVTSLFFPWKRSMFSGRLIIFCMFFSMETNSPPEILFPWHDKWHELWAVGNLALPHLRYYIYISLLCINIINLYRILRHRCIYAYTHDTLEHLNSGHSVGPALTRAAWAVWPSHDWGALGTGLMDGYNHGNDPICWDTSPRNIYRYIYICTYIYTYVCVCLVITGTAHGWDKTVINPWNIWVRRAEDGQVYFKSHVGVPCECVWKGVDP